MHKSKIDSEIKMLEEIKNKVLTNINVSDENLYEELLLLYSKVVVLIEEGIKLTDQETAMGKKVLLFLS